MAIMPTDFDRLPPHDLNAERAALCCMMLSDDSGVFEVRSILHRRMFFQEDHQVVFDAICQLADAGEGRDGIALRSQLTRMGKLDEVGGVAMLGQILNSAPSASEARYFAEQVRDHAVLRGLIKLGISARDSGYQPLQHGETATDRVAETSNRLAKLLDAVHTSKNLSIGDVVTGAFEKLGQSEASLIPTGFHSLDKIIGGLGVGEMVIVAARPSMGKSLLLRQLGVQIAGNGSPVGMISLEESGDKVGRNLLSHIARVDNRAIRSRNLTKDDWAKLATANATLNELPWYFEDRVRRLTDIKAKLAGWATRDGVKVVIIDYLQRIGGAAGKDRYERATETSLEISNMLKEFGLAGIIAAQLNRNAEHRDDKRPVMSDLRESGQIEQDADGIIFLHREDYYHLDDSDYTPTQQAELIIGKWRDSERGGIVTLRSNLPHQTFVDEGDPVQDLP